MSANPRILKEVEPDERTGRLGAVPAELFDRSDVKGIARLVIHAGLLACTSFLLGASLGTLWAISAMILHGVVLTFLFSPLHECIHATAFRSRGLNDALAFACGFLLLLPREFFRAFHLEHHRYTQDPQRDPELSAKKPGSIGEYLRHLSGLPYWRERVTTILRHARGRVAETFIPDIKQAMIVREARLHLALYAMAAIASLVAQTDVLVIYWVIPALLGQPFLRAFLLAEHTGCPCVPDMRVNTRTTISNPAVRLLTWNMPYHAEHHAWAAVPFHSLPSVHQQVRNSITHTGRGYLAVHRELWRGLGKTS
ncbi:MAG: fatty acid desaturase [Gammaproteobacteria bacterium]|nr:fatty acid desaturase [Gammaproteobacteria bacterium]